MHFRNKAFLLLLSAMLVMSAGCGSAANTVTEEAETETETTVAETETESVSETETELVSVEEVEKTVSLDAGQVSVTQVMAADVSPEEDFETESIGENAIKITGYDGDDSIVVIPDTIDGKTVTCIAKYAFFGSDAGDVRAVRLPDTVTTLEDGGAFANNRTIEIFISGSGLKTIGESSFLGCSSLHTVILRDGLETIESFAFASCSSLYRVTVPASVAEIGVSGFYDNAVNFMLYGTTGSAAETYAKIYDISFAAIDSAGDTEATENTEG